MATRIASQVFDLVFDFCLCEIDLSIDSTLGRDRQPTGNQIDTDDLPGPRATH